MPAPTYDELRAQNERLKAELRQARAAAAESRQQNQQLQAVVERLERQVATLTEAVDKAQRQGKRQAAPFSKGPPKEKPKPPGRKPGAAYGQHTRRPPPPPEKLHEVHDAPLPDACPGCGGQLDETRVDQQYQVEIPRQPVYRQFDIHIGCCRQCGQRVQGRHPLQTCDALGAAASQIGADAQAAIGILNKHAGLSHGKIATVFGDLFGIDLARSTSVRTVLRLGNRFDPAYHQIAGFVQHSDLAVLDETGWRVGGRPAWLHVAVNHDAAYYGIEPDRSHAFAEKLLSLDWSGTMIHDGWTAYDRFGDALHQQCVGHPMRRARDILETALGRAAGFPRQVLELFRQALQLRDQYRVRPVGLEQGSATADRFVDRLVGLTQRPRSYEPNDKLAAHLYEYAAEWFVFLIDPAIEATNWLAEQAIRLAVVNRKVWGGNRTWIGARAQAVVTSVIQTCRKQARPVLDFMSQTLRGLSPPLFSLSASATR